jgi:hypothetical protein
MPVFAVNWLDAQPEPAPGLDLPPEAQASQASPVTGPSAGFVYEQRIAGLGQGAYEYGLGGRKFALTVPPAAIPEEGVRIVALGDMGISEASRRTAASIAALDPDLILHAGDLSYAQGDPQAWKTWFDMIEPVAASTPWIPALGNHETYTGPGATALPWAVAGQTSPAEVAFFKQRFPLPGNELWYSFDWAGIHVIALDTFSASGGVDDGALPAGEAEWLAQDLEAHKDASWILVFLHQPPYSSSDAHGDAPRVQQAFVPLFEQYGVDVVIGGHDHTYERSYPLQGGQPSQTDPANYTTGNGVLYVITGGGGQELYQLQSQQPSWSAARASIYHVVELNVTASRIEGRIVPTNGDTFADRFVLSKDPFAGLKSVADVPPPAAVATPLPAFLLIVAAGLAVVLRGRKKAG